MAKNGDMIGRGGKVGTEMVNSFIRLTLSRASHVLQGLYHESLEVNQYS